MGAVTPDYDVAALGGGVTARLLGIGTATPKANPPRKNKRIVGRAAAIMFVFMLALV